MAKKPDIKELLDVHERILRRLKDWPDRGAIGMLTQVDEEALSALGAISCHGNLIRASIDGAHVPECSRRLKTNLSWRHARRSRGIYH